MKRYLFYIVFIVLINSSNAQSFVALRDSFLLYEYSDTVKAKRFLSIYYKKCIAKQDKQRLAEYYLLKGWYLQDRADFYGALNYFNKSAKVAKKYGYLQREADAYGNIGNVYEDMSNDVKRMEYQQLSLAICEKILKTTKDPQERKNAMAGKSAALGNLAYWYKEINQTDKAIVMLMEGMKIDSMIGNYDFLAISYSMLGNIYKESKQYDAAIHKLRRSLFIRYHLKNKGKPIIDEGIYQAYHNLGNIYKELNQLDSASYYFQKSFDLGSQLNDRFHMIFVNNSFGDLEVLKKNFPLAERYYLAAFDLAKQLHALENLVHISKSLSKLYSTMNKYENAYKYILIANQYHDSLNDSERMREIGKAEVKFKFKFKSSLDSVNYAEKLMEKDKIRLAEEEAHEAENAKKNIILFGVIFILVVVLIFSVYLVRMYHQKKKANEIISEQKKLSEHHLEIIEEKQKEIVDSINYAKRIQYALLAHDELLKKHLSDFFVLFKPKDIVSGDFYWFTHIQSENNNFSFLAVCDSTGHGVPGAFMSLLNISFINEAISEKNIFDPGEVFNHVRKRLIQNLGSEGQKDGFDGILLRIDHHNGKLCYAAANNSPIVIENNKTEVLSCDKMPVGKGEITDAFNTFEISVKQGSMLFLPTDGYSDQFGGEKARPDGSFGRGKKLKFSNMLKIINEASSLPVQQQKDFMNSKFEDWKGDLEQLDDVCVIGLKL